MMAENSNDSARQIQRYIRLTYLIPEFLDKIDNGEIALSVGVELSFLDEQSQYNFLEQCEINDCTPSYSQLGVCTRQTVRDCLPKLLFMILCAKKKQIKRNDQSLR
jgi:hypothetical protein